MPSRIYLWSPRYHKDEVGHLSLQLSDNTYISHWPAVTKKKLGTVSGDKQTYDEDVRAEGRSPNKTLVLPQGLVDEGNIKSWWAKYCGDYNVLLNNCAQVVYQALKEGRIKGHDEFSTVLSTLSHHMNPVFYNDAFRNQRIMITPTDVYNFAKRCKDYHEASPAGKIFRRFFTF